ncbi:MAG: hydroxymethylglutaryl-CoA reductase (NADPH), partial [Glaciecola sp.]
MTDDMRIPRHAENDHTEEMAKIRRDFIKEKTGADLVHTGQYSIDTSVLPGNVENFIGIVQMPVGVAGPVRINGEHAIGD